MCAHRNSDNLHNAVSIGYSLVARVMADEHRIVVLHRGRGSSDVFGILLAAQTAVDCKLCSEPRVIRSQHRLIHISPCSHHEANEGFWLAASATSSPAGGQLIT